MSSVVGMCHGTSWQTSLACLPRNRHSPCDDRAGMSIQSGHPILMVNGCRIRVLLDAASVKSTYCLLMNFPF